ncbi:two-component system, NarL family, sensor histidine kinase LiaS [Salinibacillus kushneri]|uniref:Sensor histidine kinase n=1 Tax=Salinibacillus kushneri TaxID=237682 RepID=A0A1I0BA43_9BACI|nr:sensor histidine kinase [Salinibacillus kushneri]SET03676.1 two-component system, NarL family, sensor histidine kinase LiaS [Salinibacillus kushneri]
MNWIFKQMMVGIIAAISLTILILFVTFLTFPLDNWQMLLDTYILNKFPFIWFILALSIVLGIIGGLTYGMVSRQNLQFVQRKLDELIQGPKLTTEDEGMIKDLQLIQEQILQIDEKFKKQTETFQRLATERAQDREQSLQEVVVQERNRLARELHDSVSQQLFAASMMMSAINESNPPQDTALQKQLTLTENMIHQSQLEMRALLLHLRPVALKGKSLQEGIEELLEELTQKVPMEVNWQLESISLEKGIEDQLFRIVQESVSNTLRHAKANKLEVLLIERDDHVIMRILDDGIGFNVEEAKTSSYGLQNMHERALEIGGTLKIVSLEDEGTRLEVKVPYLKDY